MPKRNLTLLQLFCEMIWHRSCDEEMDRSCDNTAQSHIVLNYSNPQTWEGFQRQQADSRCIYASLILLVKVRVEGQCHQAWLCNVNVSHHSGWGGFTPLHYAALHGNRALVNLFLSAGAGPNLACDAGQTAFHFACRWAAAAYLVKAWIFKVRAWFELVHFVLLSGKGTSTSYIKWCSMGPIYVS